ncbi:MAG TPA: shikimate kinase [Marinilabiliaceae bacterium]|nr:shikimate kinase [Marinilabiliaceae bacterium]
MKRLFLVGFMGSGKSTMGKLIAQELSWQFIDLDDYVENKAGESITSIFNNLGEEGFRKMEREALEEVIHLEEVVIATGGGIPCFYDNMEFMKLHGLVIYLKLSPKELCDRLLPIRSDRPLISNKSDEELLDFIEIKLAEREPFYSQANILAESVALDTSLYIQLINDYIRGE